MDKRRHSQDEYDAAIAAAFAPGTTLYDMAMEEAMTENYGATESERGVIEGARRVFIGFLNTAMNYGRDNAA